MTPERYRLVESLFDQAICIADAESRARFIEAATQTDPELATELQLLLASYETWSSPLDLPPPVLLRVGPYECVEQLGVGGMGTVYRARRVDGQFQQEVAIKFLRSSLQADSYRTRFAAERQILAHLNHPNIARLLDGGMTSEGAPYLVMEYVQGDSIDQYCQRQGFGIQERIRLFQQVLAAVDAAHRSLVVHRDLKPSNILVNHEGSVKLLDFGASQLLDPDANLTEIGALTPSYASPELLRGEPASTASDVFSLGVVLFELLTGTRPFPGATSYVASLERSLRDTEPARSGLPYDLDAVLRKAMRRRPDLRHASVAALDDDLQRYLDGRPVSARDPHWGYLTLRFLRRHQRALVAAAVALLLLIAAGVYAWRQQIAAAQRFEESRQISRYVLFELFDDVSQLPGSTALRARMAQTAQQQLDKLAALSSQNLDLRLDTARGYNRLAEVYGVPGYANLGRPREALDSLRLARELLAVVPRASLERARTALLEARIQMYLFGNTEAARALVDDAEQQIKMASPSTVTSPHTASEALDTISAVADDERRELGIHLRRVRGDLLDFDGLWAQEGDNARQGLAELDAWPQALQARPAYAMHRAHLLRQSGNQHYYEKHYSRALADYQQAFNLLEEQRKRHPENPALLGALLSAGYDVGCTLDMLGSVPEAIAAFENALRAADQVMRNESNDQTLIRHTGILRQGLAELYASQRRFPEAVALITNEVEFRKRRWNQRPEEASLERDLAYAELALGNVLSHVGRAADACTVWRQAAQRYHRFESKGAMTAWDQAQGLGKLKEAMSACSEGSR